MSKKNFIEACVAASNCTMVHSRNEVNLFCDIMEWSKEDVYFVGDDPHGVVSLGDYFFNMSDIHEVVSNYPKLLERFGSNEELSNIIISWYDWTIEYHSKHPVMDWQKVELFNALTKKTEYNTPPIPEGKMCSDKILFKTKEYGMYNGLFDGKKFLIEPDWRGAFDPKETSYWMEINEPTNEHYINMHSWLMGACDIIKKRK